MEEIIQNKQESIEILEQTMRRIRKRIERTKKLKKKLFVDSGFKEGPLWDVLKKEIETSYDRLQEIQRHHVEETWELEDIKEKLVKHELTPALAD